MLENSLIKMRDDEVARELVALDETDTFFMRIQSRFPTLAKMSFDELLAANREEYVFRLIDGSRTDNLGHTFRHFLEEHDLLKDQFGKNRSLYSLRHLYATFALQQNRVSHHQLAVQMGTSIAMIEKYYSNVNT